MTTALANCYETLNTFNRSADGFRRVVATWVQAFREDKPEDLIESLAEWIGAMPNFPAPCEIRPLIDERAKRRMDAMPKIAHNRAKEAPVNYTFDERVRFAEKIHDGMAGILALSGRKMSAPRNEWIVGWMRSSVTKDCFLRRITNAAAAGFHAQIDALAARLGVGATPEINQAETTKYLCGGFNAA